MNCETVRPYLPAHAGGEITPETARTVEEHLSSCAACRSEAESLARVRTALASLREREVEPPPYVIDAVLEDVRSRRARRLLPVPLLPPQEILRVVQENRDAILSAAGAALVVAGAAWALWRATRALRPQPAPAR